MSITLRTDTNAERRTTIVRGTFVGAALALVATAIIFAIGMAGAPIRVVTGWSPDGADLTIAEVLVTAAVAVVLGGLLLAWWQRRDHRAWPRWIVVASAVAVLSALPLWGLDVDTGSKLSLTLMHLATGAAAIAGHAAARRRVVDAVE